MAKPSTTRFTVSLPDTLMRTLDRLRSRRAYKEEWAERRGDTVGVLVLVYDHDTRALSDKLADLQHQSYRTITATLHVHLDEHACLELIALRAPSRQIRHIADQLIAVKGVRYGQLVPATTGKRLT